MKRPPKYSNVKRAVKGGLRRATKAELKALGYSPRSVLYTKKVVKNPTKFLTRADVASVVKPEKEKKLFKTFGFVEVKRERIKAARRKLFRHTFVVYKDINSPITLTKCVEITKQFFSFLQAKFNPNALNQIGLIYKGADDDFSLQPRLWRDRESLIIDSLEKMVNKYKAKMKIIFIIGWIEQSN